MHFGACKSRISYYNLGAWSIFCSKTIDIKVIRLLIGLSLNNYPHNMKEGASEPLKTKVNMKEGSI